MPYLDDLERTDRIDFECEVCGEGFNHILGQCPRCGHIEDDDDTQERKEL